MIRLSFIPSTSVLAPSLPSPSLPAASTAPGTWTPRAACTSPPPSCTSTSSSPSRPCGRKTPAHLLLLCLLLSQLVVVLHLPHLVSRIRSRVLGDNPRSAHDDGAARMRSHMLQPRHHSMDSLLLLLERGLLPLDSRHGDQEEEEEARCRRQQATNAPLHARHHCYLHHETSASSQL